MAAKNKKKQAKPRLTPKQEAFCVCYVATGVGAVAYREAYDAKNMKPGGIYREASLLLDVPKVAQRVAELQSRAAKRAEISAGRVLREYGKLAFVDIRKAFNEAGELKSVHELDDETAAAIAGIEFEEVFDWNEAGEHRQRVHSGRIHKLKLSDKKAALDALAKCLGMGISRITEEVQQQVESGQTTWEEFIQIYRRGSNAPADAPVE